MKRIVIAGVLLVSVFALSGIATGSASAAYHCLHARYFGQYDKDGPRGAQCREYLVIPLLFNWDLFQTTGAKSIAVGQLCALVEAGEASLFNGANCGPEEEQKGEGKYEIALQDQWLIAGKSVSTATAVKSSGTLVLTDLGAGTSIECTVKDEGKVGPGPSDEVTATSTSCGFVSGKAGSCEAGKPVTAKALRLPWKTELMPINESIHDEVSGTGGNPGWDVECTVLGVFKTQDECTSPNAEPQMSNVTGGVDTTFEASEKYSCSVGGENAGMVVGKDLIESPSGGTLTVYEP